MMPTKMKKAALCPLVLLIALHAGARTFTDTKGRTLEAEIQKVEGTGVTLRKADGQVAFVPLALLSAADQEFVKAWKPAGAGAESKPAATPAEDVKPGATLTLDFPDLSPDRHDKPAQCQVSIPKGYDPAKKLPLVVWLGGGDGGNTANLGFLPEGEFVAAGLPYPKGASNPAQSNMVGQFEKIWAYHKRMIEEITKRVPNIDPASSIVGGFSNGGHTIDGVLRLGKKDGLADHFSVFILADGGGSASTGKGSYPSLKGKFAYVCWGEKSPNKPNAPDVTKQFKSHSAQVVASEMKDTGHEFAESEREKVKAWLKDVVLPALAKAPGTK